MEREREHQRAVYPLLETVRDILGGGWVIECN